MLLLLYTCCAGQKYKLWHVLCPEPCRRQPATPDSLAHHTTNPSLWLPAGAYRRRPAAPTPCMSCFVRTPRHTQQQHRNRAGQASNRQLGTKLTLLAVVQNKEGVGGRTADLPTEISSVCPARTQLTQRRVGGWMATAPDRGCTNGCKRVNTQQKAAASGRVQVQGRVPVL